MIWRYIFPKEGGGSMRRIIHLKRVLAQRRLEGVKLTESPTEKLKPLALFDFSRHDDAVDAKNSDASGRKGGWRYSDDETIGGYSASKLSFVQGPTIHNKNINDDGNFKHQRHGGVDYEATDKIKAANNDDVIGGQGDFIPFLRFEGITDTTLPKASKKVVRSGFCALRSPDFILGGADIGQFYNALEIKCRLDARIYTVNLKVRTFFVDDLYQSFVTRPPNEQAGNNSEEEWRTLILPFDEFVLTAFGRMREVQRKLDGGIIIEHIGIMLADGQDGPFQFDLASVRCINYYPTTRSYWSQNEDCAIKVGDRNSTMIKGTFLK
jgi:hypothetical protein